MLFDRVAVRLGPSNPKYALAPFRLAALCAVVFALASAAPMSPQTQPAASPAPDAAIVGQVVFHDGSPTAGAKVRNASGKLLGKTNSSGHLTLRCSAPCSVRIEFPGVPPQTVEWQSATPIVLKTDGKNGLVSNETVTVTAYRTPLGDLESPASTRVLSGKDLQESAALTLDGQLREVGGLETFRRSSSLVANPSSQGLSLRGLGSTSASRTLVTEDDIPLNDAFAGWIHWEELPELSVKSIEVVRGGASDLYGSSAIGGVVNVLPRVPSDNRLELKSDYGSENTYQDSLLLEGHRDAWAGLLTGGILGTDGFIQTAPSQRGAIDTNSNVHAQNAVARMDRVHDELKLFLRTSALNEARDNGTPLQKNGIRIWRFATGADWVYSPSGILTFRAYGSTTHYRQTFSTISSMQGCPFGTAPVPRNFECLNRFAKTPDDEMGLVLHWTQPIRYGLTFLAGADTHDVRAGDFESVIKSGVHSQVNLHDRQRLTGAYGEVLWNPKAQAYTWTIAASARIDWFSNFDGYQWLPAPKALPHDAEHPIDPRLGISHKLGQHFAAFGSGFRGFRAPTANELYRSTQVGSFLTLPNPNLQSERATGWETGVAMEQKWGTVRTSYFWTRINRPVTALTLNPNSNPIQLMRANLGQIESRGISTDLELKPTSWSTLQAGYQYTNATVTQGTGTAPAGNWIPQVAHQMATAQLRGYRSRIGSISLQAKISGRQFDDDANQYLLHGYFKLDIYAAHRFGKRTEVFTSGENLFNRQIEVGRTPTLTLGTPRVARIGFRLNLGPITN